MARINTDNAEKSRGVFAARMERLFLQIPSQASLQLSFQKPRHPGKPGMPRAFSGCQFLALFFLSRMARKAGPLAEREGDVFSQSRASSLVIGFENSAPAWLAQAPPFASALSVYILVI
jgi:hypothetical protein